MAESYYTSKLASLVDIFGSDSIELLSDRLTVAGVVYPIVDDVIICLDPIHYTPRLRRMLGLSQSGAGATTDHFDTSIQDTFGAEWSTYSDVRIEHKAEFDAYFDLVELDDLNDKRVCDLGCGSGRWAFYIQNRCRELVMVDFSDAIFVARQNLKSSTHCIFIMADLRLIPFRNEFADFIYCLGVLHHLPTDALDEIRSLARFSRRFLFYLYYSLDNRPWYFRALLRTVTVAREQLASQHNERFRKAVVALIAATVYFPLIYIGSALNVLGLGRFVPLYEGYRNKTWRRVCQDVYDRFFTSIEQRFSKQDIVSKLNDIFELRVSSTLPYWHFVCDRRE